MTTTTTSSRTFHNVDRTVAITTDSNGIITTISLQGNMSHSRLNRELCALHHKATADLPSFLPNGHKNYDHLLEELSQPPTPALAAIYQILEKSLRELSTVQQSYSQQSTVGETKNYRVVLNSVGELTEIIPTSSAEKLSSTDRGPHILEAYQQALGKIQQFSAEIEQQLEKTFEELFPEERLKRQ